MLQPLLLGLRSESNKRACLYGFIAAGQVIRLQKREAPFGIFEGEEAVYHASLTEEPSADIYLDVYSKDERSEVRTLQLKFSNTNWAEKQEIKIFARDDDVIEITPYYTVIEFNSTSSNESLSQTITIPLPIIDADTGEQQLDKIFWYTLYSFLMYSPHTYTSLESFIESVIHLGPHVATRRILYNLNA